MAEDLGEDPVGVKAGSRDRESRDEEVAGTTFLKFKSRMDMIPPAMKFDESFIGVHAAGSYMVSQMDRDRKRERIFG